MKIPVSKWLYFFLRFFSFPVIWETSVGAVVFRRVNGERLYLLLHYPSGHYDFAKGHVEKGETEEMTLRRETEEESGIKDLQVFPHRVSIRYFYVAKGTERAKRRGKAQGIWIFKEVHFYPAETATEAVTISHEHQGHIWEKYDAALERVTFDNAKRVLRETEEYLLRSEASK